MIWYTRVRHLNTQREKIINTRNSCIVLLIIILFTFCDIFTNYLPTIYSCGTHSDWNVNVHLCRSHLFSIFWYDVFNDQIDNKLSLPYYWYYKIVNENFRAFFFSGYICVVVVAVVFLGRLLVFDFELIGAMALSWHTVTVICSHNEFKFFISVFNVCILSHYQWHTHARTHTNQRIFGTHVYYLLYSNERKSWRG